MEHEGDRDTNCIQSAWKNPQRIGKGNRRCGKKRTNGDYPDYSIIKIGQNTEKCSKDLRKFAVSREKNII